MKKRYFHTFTNERKIYNKWVQLGQHDGSLEENFRVRDDIELSSCDYCNDAFAEEELQSGLFCDSAASTDSCSWDGSTAELSLHVCSGRTVHANIGYKIVFGIINPTSQRDSAPVQIYSKGTFVEIATSYMTKSGETILGVERGSDPLQIEEPSFNKREMVQSTPIAGMTNSLTLTLPF